MSEQASESKQQAVQLIFTLCDSVSCHIGSGTCLGLSAQACQQIVSVLSRQPDYWSAQLGTMLSQDRDLNKDFNHLPDAVERMLVLQSRWSQRASNDLAGLSWR